MVLDFTDHLSDYQLYGLIFRDILPSHEKKLERRTSYLHWDCANIEENPDIWLRYYATASERQMWAEEYDQPLPPHDEPPFRREVPRAPLKPIFGAFSSSTQLRLAMSTPRVSLWPAHRALEKAERTSKIAVTSKMNSSCRFIWIYW